MDEGGGPAIIEELIANYRAQKYLTASKGLYDIFRDDTYPEHRTKVAYYLAKSLYDMGMYHGAQRYFLEVVRGGPSNPYFKYALPPPRRYRETHGERRRAAALRRQGAA